MAGPTRGDIVAGAGPSAGPSALLAAGPVIVSGAMPVFLFTNKKLFHL